nr:Chain C, GP41 PEPTIDE [Human immunodeficiency virus 1]
DLDRWAS